MSMGAWGPEAVGGPETGRVWVCGVSMASLWAASRQKEGLT